MNGFVTSVLLFFICYFTVTTLGILNTIFNIYVLKMKPIDKEGYKKIKPWNPIYNVIIFPLFGCLYMKGISDPSMNIAIITGITWLGITIVIDLFGWVIIKHPWSFDFNEFYVDYQPWITFIYTAIFLSPIIGYLFV